MGFAPFHPTAQGAANSPVQLQTPNKIGKQLPSQPPSPSLVWICIGDFIFFKEKGNVWNFLSLCLEFLQQMALQHNLRFPSGALMLSFAWHAEREPSSGLLDIFSHALLSRSCERNLSGSDAAAPPAWLQRAPRAVAALDVEGAAPEPNPPVHPGSAPPPGCRAAGKEGSRPKRCYC